MPRRYTEEERIKAFWSKVNITDLFACWVWTGRTLAYGYGHVAWKERKAVVAHRLSYELSIGAIPEGMSVLHKCDNPPCVNPSHLFLGTHADNMADMVRKGRQARNRGERAGPSKLKNTDIVEIFKLYGQRVRGDDLAKRFGVTRTCLSDVLNRKTWSHISISDTDLAVAAEVAKSPPSGESASQAKLTMQDVRDIRNAYEAGGITVRELGSRYGVHSSSICNAINRKSWR